MWRMRKGQEALGVRGRKMELINKEIDWDENHGYARPWFTVTVEDDGRFKLNCYDEYIVVLSDVGLVELKEAVDLAYAISLKSD